MITINLMLVLKIMSLILLGTACLSLGCYLVKNPEKVHFVTAFIGTLVFLLPFIYIYLN